MPHTFPETYQPIYEFTRGQTVESVHFGAVAIVERAGTLLAWHGNPQAVTFLRSTAKPFQALPFVESLAPQAFGLTLREIALICASHNGTDEHAAVAASIQRKVGLTEDHLHCGIHPPGHIPTREALQARGQAPTPNRHNCSGKHTGMLAHAVYRGWPLETYLDPAHPLQTSILACLAEMSSLPPDEIRTGIDGCSAPNFAIPLVRAAWAYARLCDPDGLPPARAQACHTITRAMTTYPDMVAGPGAFDTRLMQATGGRILAKGGAEGYQGLGLLPGVLAPGSPGVGITVKISDGAARSGVRSAVVMEVLRQLNVLSAEEWETLAECGPRLPVHNYRKILVGEGRPCFNLQWT